MNGFQASRKIRQFEQEQGLLPVTIIAVTGAASIHARKEASISGIDRFLTKPIPLKELSGFIEEWEGKGKGGWKAGLSKTFTITLQHNDDNGLERIGYLSLKYREESNRYKLWPRVFLNQVHRLQGKLGVMESGADWRSGAHAMAWVRRALYISEMGCAAGCGR